MLIPALFIPKIRAFLKGRKGLIKDLKAWRSNVEGDVIWVHCASLGEFEMARPMIDSPDLTASSDDKHPKATLLITFFSPSGFNVVNRTEGYNVFYLPLDTKRNARRFVSIVKPKEAFFVKNEFWFNLLYYLKKEGITIYLINGIIRNDQIFFKWYASWFKKHLSYFNRLFVQDEKSFDHLLMLDVEKEKITVTGDMRYDRVADIRKRGARLPEIEKFKTAEHLIIGGSTWPSEEEILAVFLSEHTNYDCIIAPHDVSPEHIRSIEKMMFPFGVAKYSEWDKKSNDFRVLIVDSVGLLSRIYRYGDIAFVGGGFGAGLHNIIEPAGFGLPVIFGPKTDKFPEANIFIEEGIGYRIKDADSFSRAVRAAHFSNTFEDVIGKMKGLQGATRKITNVIRS